MLNYRQYISNYVIYIFVETRGTSVHVHLLKQKIIIRDHRSRHPLLQTLIPLHINRRRRSRYTNEFLNKINSFNRK